MIECQPSESDDVMTRLRWWAFKFCGKGERENLASDTMSDAIAHIEQLEAALREISHLNNMRDRFSSEIDAIITRVVEKKDD
jgi:hypothetical protein